MAPTRKSRQLFFACTRISRLIGDPVTAKRLMDNEVRNWQKIQGWSGRSSGGVQAQGERNGKKGEKATATATATATAGEVGCQWKKCKINIWVGR